MSLFSVPLSIQRVLFTLLLTTFVTSCESAPPEHATAPVVASSQQALTSSHSHPANIHWKTVGTFAELVTSADLVVRARVSGQRAAAMRLYPWNEAAHRPMTAQEAGNVYNEAPLTVSTLSIEEVVRGKETAVTLRGEPVGPHGTIEIVELGGRLADGCLSTPDDKPLLQPAQEGLFFITSAGQPGAYHVIGGWQGRLEIQQGFIRALATAVHPEATDFSRHTGKPVAEVLAEVRSIP